MKVDPGDQVAYMLSIDAQLGSRLVFWVNLIMDDLNMESLGNAMVEAGRPASDAEGLSLFATLGLREMDGTPKPALEIWEGFRAARDQEWQSGWIVRKAN